MDTLQNLIQKLETENHDLLTTLNYLKKHALQVPSTVVAAANTEKFEDTYPAVDPIKRRYVINKYDKEFLDILQKKLDDGLSIREISNEMAIPYSTLCWKVNSHKLIYPKKHKKRHGYYRDTGEPTFITLVGDSIEDIIELVKIKKTKREIWHELGFDKIMKYTTFVRTVTYFITNQKTPEIEGLIRISKRHQGFLDKADFDEWMKTKTPYTAVELAALYNKKFNTHFTPPAFLYHLSKYGYKRWRKRWVIPTLQSEHTSIL